MRPVLAVVTSLTLALTVFAAPAAATPRADFSYSPAEPRAGEPVSLFTTGAGCDARPCTYRWREIAPDGTVTGLGFGRSHVVRFASEGATSIELTVTNRGFRAPPGPTAASTAKTITVGPPLDTAGPETTITSGPAETSASADATFEFSSEEGATFECRLDEGEWAPCVLSSTTPPTVVLTGLADGAHIFSVRATDADGNVELAEDIYAWTVDTTPPAEEPVPPVDPFEGLDCQFGWVTFCVAPPEVAA